MIAHAGVTEVQGRLSPHMHFVVCTDLAPHVWRRYINDPELRAKLTARLDSVLSAMLSKDEIQTTNSSPVSTSSCKDPETPLIRDGRVPAQTATMDQIRERAAAVIRSCNIHNHSATCSKSEIGKRQCRMGKPTACWNNDTSVVELYGDYDSAGKFRPRALREMTEDKPSDDPILEWKEKRTLIVELKRTADNESREQHDGDDRFWIDIEYDDKNLNSRVVNFLPALSAALGCNTDVEHLGSMTASKSAMFYLVKYITKDEHQFTNVLPLIKAAHEHTQTYPSIAKDAGQAERNTKYLLTRILNSMNDSEVGTQIACLALLRFPSNVYSHDFWFCFINPASKYAKAQQKIHLPGKHLEADSEDNETEYMHSRIWSSTSI